MTEEEIEERLDELIKRYRLRIGIFCNEDLEKIKKEYLELMKRLENPLK